MTPDLPAPDQAEGATAHAEAEQARADVDAALASGELTLAGLFAAVDAEPSGDDHRPIGHMHIRRALLALPHVGETRADELLASLELDGSRHLDTIGVAQRGVLIDEASAYQPKAES